MDLVALVVACGIAAQSPIFVPLGTQPDCAAPPLAGESTAFVAAMSWSIAGQPRSPPPGIGLPSRHNGSALSCGPRAAASRR